MLETLTAREFRQFVDFVHSPYFNKHERLMAFADYLLVHIPEDNEPDLDRELIFEHLFPGEEYHEQRLADLMSYLVKLLEQFFAQQHFESRGFNQDYHLMADLAQRDLEKSYNKAFRTLKKSQKKKKIKNENFYMQEYLFWDESDHYYMRQQQRTTDESLQHKVDALDHFYLAAKLKNACEMANRQNVIEVNYNHWLTEELLRSLKANIGDYEDHPAIVVYYHILQCLTEPNDHAHFDRLKEVMQRHGKHFAQKTENEREKEEIRYMYLYVQNYCIHNINKGNRQYLRELFELYQWLLESEIILDEREELSQWDYKNIVSAGHRLDEFEWTEKFVYKYKDKLPEHARENAFNYNLAVLLYHKPDYKQSKRVLQSVEFDDVYYAVGGRALLMRIYYETDDFDPLYSLIDSFQIYMRRNKKISSYQKELHQNFIKIMRKLTNMKVKLIADASAVEQQDVEQLRALIDEYKQVAYTGWLFKRLDDIAAQIGSAGSAQVAAGGA